MLVRYGGGEVLRVKNNSQIFFTKGLARFLFVLLFGRDAQTRTRAVSQNPSFNTVVEENL